MQVNRPLLAVAIVGGLIAAALALGGDAFTDLQVYRYGGRQVLLDGGNLYAPRDGLPFTYTPSGALLMVPLALPPIALVAGMWAAATIYCLGAVAGLFVGDRPTGRRREWLVAALAVSSLALEPVRANLGFAQVNVFLMLGIAWDLLRPQRRLSGVWIGLAAALKLTPLSFVFFLLLVRRGRAAGVAAATFAATIALGFVALPSASTAYWTEVLWDPNRVGGVAYAGNQSILGAMSRVLGDQPGTALWFAVAGPVTLVIMLVAAAWWRAGRRELGACLAAAGMLVASPISWTHHYVWVFPLAIALVRSARGRAAWCGVLVWVAVFVLGTVWWPPYSEDRELQWSVGQQLVGNAYVIALLMLVGWLALARPRQTVEARWPTRVTTRFRTTPTATQTTVESSGQRSK